MISNMFIKRILFDREYHLYELLKLKKNLERTYLSGSKDLTSPNIKSNIRNFILTWSFHFIFNRDVLSKIRIIENKLKNNFNSYKIKGDSFIVKNIESTNKSYKTSLVNNFINYNLELENHGSMLFVQGSYADGTQLSYSDYDLVILGTLNEEVVEIKKRIEADIYKADPLQHHGVFFINKHSFKNYWQGDLPIITFKNSIYFSKKKIIKIEIEQTFKESYSAYYYVKSFIDMYKEFPLSHESGAYFTKFFLSQFMLVPALLLAIKSEYVLKKESFLLAKKMYSSEAWKSMNLVSKIRKDWNQSNIDKNYFLKRKNSFPYVDYEYNNFKNVDNNINKAKINEIKESYKLFILETEKLIQLTK